MKDETNGTYATRRAMLAGLGAGVIGVAASGAQARQGLVPGAAGGQERGEIGDWTRRIGARFSVAGEPGSGLKLVKVERLRSGGRRPLRVERRENFALVFEASGRAPAGGTTYWLSNGAIGALPLYLGNQTKSGRKTRFVAVFN